MIESGKEIRSGWTAFTIDHLGQPQLGSTAESESNASDGLASISRASSEHVANTLGHDFVVIPRENSLFDGPAKGRRMLDSGKPAPAQTLHEALDDWRNVQKNVPLHDQNDEHGIARPNLRKPEHDRMKAEVLNRLGVFLHVFSTQPESLDVKAEALATLISSTRCHFRNSGKKKPLERVNLKLHSQIKTLLADERVTAHPQAQLVASLLESPGYRVHMETETKNSLVHKARHLMDEDLPQTMQDRLESSLGSLFAEKAAIDGPAATRESPGIRVIRHSDYRRAIDAAVNESNKQVRVRA